MDGEKTPRMPPGGKRVADYLRSQLCSPNPCLTPRGGSLYKYPTPPSIATPEDALREQRKLGLIALLASPFSVLKSFPLKAEDENENVQDEDEVEEDRLSDSGSEGSSSYNSEGWCSARERAASCISESCASEIWSDAQTLDAQSECGTERSAGPASQRNYVIPRLRMEEVFRAQASETPVCAPAKVYNNVLYQTDTDETGEGDGVQVPVAYSDTIVEPIHAPTLPLLNAVGSSSSSPPACTPAEVTSTPASEKSRETTSEAEKTFPEFEFQVTAKKLLSQYENKFSLLSMSPRQELLRQQSSTREGSAEDLSATDAPTCDALRTEGPVTMELSPCRATTPFCRSHSTQLASPGSHLGTPLSHRSQMSLLSHRSLNSLHSPGELMRASSAFRNAVSGEVESHLEDLLICLGQEEQKVRIFSNFLLELGYSPEALLRENGLDDESLANQICDVSEDDAEPSKSLVVSPSPYKASTPASGPRATVQKRGGSPTSVLDGLSQESPDSKATSPQHALETSDKHAQHNRSQAVALKGLGYLGWVLLGMSKLAKT
eukprot:1182197-Prorocentrum_minimum.AAC.1